MTDTPRKQYVAPADRIAEIFARKMAARFGANPASWVMHLDFVREIMRDADDWSPIDTAPKDGTEVLIWDKGDRLGEIVIGAWDLNTDWRHEPGGWPLNATHWMPLPSPPSEADAGDDITRE